MMYQKENDFYIVYYINLKDKYGLSYNIHDFDSDDIGGESFKIDYPTLLSINRFIDSDFMKKPELLAVNTIDNRMSSLFKIDLSTKTQIGLPYFFSEEGIEHILYKGRNEFRRDKLVMLLEFKNPTITKIPWVLIDNWVQCPKCTEAWELEYPLFEMCLCPKCKEVYLNPYTDQPLPTDILP